jgi:hypothetical protein
MKAASYCVLLFHSVSQALVAEKVLKREGLPHKVIPVPRKISSDCGVCIRFEPDERDRITSVLAGKVEVQEICSL